ncbi:DUF2267 domain-containing protein [Pseudochryseolinea flava]|nr:DUF2267 domain-containing protein [Pseudochryseolinea flava]
MYKTITYNNLFDMKQDTSNPTPPQQDDEMIFFRQIAKELSIEEPKEVVILVASVLQALRQTLPLDRASLLINELPDFLKLTFAANWKRDEEIVKIDHLDEFVNLVMARDRKSKKNLFKSEVHALSAIILTLKNLYKLVNLDKFEGLSQALKQELREVPVEAAA